MASARTDAEGRFSTSFVVPENPDFEAEQSLPVMVTIEGSDGSALTYLVVSDDAASEEAVAAAAPTEEPTTTPVFPTPTPLAPPAVTITPVPTPPLVLEATARPRRPTPLFVPTPLRFPTRTPTLTPTGLPTPDDVARVIVVINALNVRSGPGINYPIIGQVRANQEYEVLGRYGRWWLISFPSRADDQGWISGDYVEAENIKNVPIIIPPPAPTPSATFTPVPTPTKVQVCNPGQWTGCGGQPPAVVCLPDHVSQCTSEGQWGQCLWDPGFCWGDGGDDDDDDDDADGDDDDDDHDDDDTGDDDDDEDDDDPAR